MCKKNFCLILFIIQQFCNGESVNYNSYTSKSLPQSELPQIEPHLLQATSPEAYNNNNAANTYSSSYEQQHVVTPEIEQNGQPNSNYQQFYHYYDSPFQHHYQPQTNQPTRPTQLWSGPPIVVDEDDMFLTSNTQPSSTLYKTPLYRNSKTLPVYNQQQQQTSTRLNYDNNNIVYPRDFRHQNVDLPEAKYEQQHFPTYNQQQQYGPPQQFYASNTDLRYDSIPNDYSSFLKKDSVIDYSDYFKRYLQNNPRRIEPKY